MPRSPQFKPAYFPGRKNPWMISIPAIISPTGKRAKRFFRTEGEARGFARRVRALWDRREILIDAQALLPPGVSVMDAAVRFREQAAQEVKSQAFGKCFDEYLAQDKGWKAGTIGALRAIRNKYFPRIGEELLINITPDMLEAPMKGLAYESKRTYRKHLAAFFTWAAKPRRGWCRGNPASEIELGLAPQREIEILDLDEVRALMAAADDLQGFFALSIFGGLRAAEARRALWGDVDFEEGFLRVRQSKVREMPKMRTLRLSEAMRSWLDPIRGNEKALIVPEKNFRKRFEAARERAKLGRWTKSICRHTFASHHLNYFHELTILLEEMGHQEDNPRTLRKHYYRAVSERVAREFWEEIRP